MLKRIFALFLVFAVIFSLSACSIFKNGYPITVGGAEIENKPERIACLSEFSASAISALGYKESIAGAVTEYINSTGVTVADLGYSNQINWEDVYTLAPDAVILPYTPDENYLSELKKRNIAPIVLKTPQTFDEAKNYYTELSKLFLGSEDYADTAEVYTWDMQRAITEAKEKLNNVNSKISVFIESGFLVTGDTLAGEVLLAAGFNNIAQNETDFMMSGDDFIKANPDAIFCPKGLSKSILENEAFKDIAAIKSGAVYEIDIFALIYAGEGFASVLGEMANYLA